MACDNEFSHGVDMYGYDEEIYDDTGAEMSIASNPVSALKSRFEQQNADTGPKPAVIPKPPLKPKYGGGPGLNIAVGANVPKPVGQSAINKPNVEDKGNDSPVGWQGRKKEVSEPDGENKPKLVPKPVAKWQKNDTNNNAAVNGVPSTGVKPDIGAKKVPGKLDLESKFGGLNIPIPVPIGVPAAGVNVSSPKNKTADAHIPKQVTKSAAADKQNSPTPKPKIGAHPGVNILPKNSVTNGPIDFRSRLKPAAERKSSFDSGGHNDNSVQLRASKFGPRVSMKRVSITTVIRTSDGKKFQKLNKKSLNDGATAPEKPAKPDFDIDIDQLAQDYKFAVEELDAADKESHGFTEFEEEEFYDDCGNLQETRKKSRVVSLIPTMTEEEEAEWTEQGFPGLPDDTFPAPPPELLQEDYDDANMGPPAVVEEDGELYEPLSEMDDDLPPPPGPKPGEEAPPVPSAPLPSSASDKSISDKSKEQKELEKERKRKEKEEKELLKKKEKELKKLIKLLKVTPEILTQTVGKGKVKTNAKGKEKAGELTVTAGEEVDIIRMVDNPKGKWLVRILSTEKVGYCDENNIEFMKSSAADKKNSISSASMDGPQETYEDVDGEGNEADLIEDEIYEECN